MKNPTLERMAKKKYQPKIVLVEQLFIQHWHVIRMIDAVNYSSLIGYAFNLDNTDQKENVLAFYLLGCCKVLEQSTGDCPNTAEQAWEAVQQFIPELVPKGFVINDLKVNVEYNRPLTGDFHYSHLVRKGKTA